MHLATFLALSTILAAATTLAACTETPSDFPPCVDPNHPCAPYEAGADASDSGLVDGLSEATVADGP